MSSCAYYSLAGSIPPHINSIAIPIVENQTAEFGMSESVTENILTKFNEENIYFINDKVIKYFSNHSIVKNRLKRSEFLKYGG